MRVLQQPPEGGLHGRPLAPVHLMGEKSDLRMLGGAQEGLQMVGVAAVIDQNDLPKSRLQQAVSSGFRDGTTAVTSL